MADTVQNVLNKSTSLSDFESKINNEEGFETYSRKGVLTGIVKDGRKYRFKTLGIQLIQESLKVLQRLDELKNIESGQERDKGKGIER